MTSSTDASRGASSGPRGTSNGTRASDSVRLARTMRWAIVGSGTRKARAISAVVRPPSRRSVSATRASVASTGWQDVKMRRRRSSPMSSSIAFSTCATASSRSSSRSRPSSSCFRSRRFPGGARRSRGSSPSPSTRRPGCRGRRLRPLSSAEISASCASSSARPTSRTMRASPAIRRGDSMRKTASIARLVSDAGAVTAPDQTIFSGAQAPVGQPWSPAPRTSR